MLHGTQQDNMKYVVDMQDRVNANRNFIVAPGCDMPFNTPPENVIGVAQAVQDPEAARVLVEGYVRDDLDIDVEMPDYANLDHALIEVLTIDSATCAACGYMKAAADDMVAEFGDKVEIIERKITVAENIARLGKLGVANLPTIAINGQVKFISVIPNRDQLKSAVNEFI